MYLASRIPSNSNTTGYSGIGVPRTTYRQTIAKKPSPTSLDNENFQNQGLLVIPHCSIELLYVASDN